VRTGGTLLWPEIRREGNKFLAGAREAHQLIFEVTRSDFSLQQFQPAGPLFFDRLALQIVDKRTVLKISEQSNNNLTRHYQ
jgi:hypothetical protein